MKFNKTLFYIFRSTILSIWTYIFVICIPLIISVCIYFLFLKNLVLTENKEKLIAFSTMPLILMTFFSAHFLLNWRETVFLRQLNNFGVTKTCFFITFLLVFTIYSFISYLFSNIFILILDSTISEGNYKNLFFGFKNFAGCIIYILGLFLMIFLYFSISFLIAGKIKNVYLVNAIILIVISYIFVFSDFFLETSLYDNEVVSIFSFTSPQKYLNWIFYLTYSGGFIEKILIYQFITKINSIVYFSGVVIPIISSFMFITPLATISYIWFSTSLK